MTPASSAGVDRVTAGPPVRKTLQLTTEQPGRVAAFEEAPIVSKIAGYVESVHGEIGDKVAKGQVLIRIRAPEYNDQLEQKKSMLVQAQANIHQAEAALQAARAAEHSSKAKYAQAEAGVGRVDAEFARWKSEHHRIEVLVEKGTVTQKLADETRSQFLAAEAAKREVQASIESAGALQEEAKARVATSQADLEASHAKLKVAEAEIRQAETMLSYTGLTCPFEGYITSRNVDTGHYVQPAGSASTPLLTIANVNKVRIFVSVPESEASWVDAGLGDKEKGDQVVISMGARGKIEARITRTSLQLDPQSRTLTTEIDTDNANMKLLPGAFVTAKIVLETRPDVLTLPIAAIVKKDNTTNCCVVKDSKIELRLIELGLRVGDDVEVTTGLDGSETVVLARAGSLQHGQQVEVIQKPK